MAASTLFVFFLFVAAVYGYEGGDGYGLHKYGPAPLGHDGRVIDTPEVAKLKELNYEIYLDAAHKSSPVYHYRTPDGVQYHQKGGYQYNTKGEGITGSGFVYSDVSGYKYDTNHGYTTHPIVRRSLGSYRNEDYMDHHLVDGVYLPYTPEVAKARHEHFRVFDAIKEHQMRALHHLSK